MPAGKMVLAYNPKRRSSYRRRGPSRFKKAVATIAKKTLMKKTETKTNAVTISQPFGTGGYLLDIWSPVTTGATQGTRVGDQISSLGVRFRGLIEQTATITAQQSRNAVRMMVVVGKRPLTIGDMPSTSGTVDPELITVLKDFYINFDTTKLARWYNFWIPMKRIVKYDAAGAAIRCPIYMYWVADGGTGILSASGNSVGATIQRYFKDV